MGMFSFRRAKEREAAEKAASIPPVETPKPKRKRQPKPKKVSDNGNLDSIDGGISNRE
jgi:hypothetical protein